jgi:copper(I)-binding protein
MECPAVRQKPWKQKAWKKARPLWLAAAMLALLGGATVAETYKVGSIEIANPWARATPKGTSVGGAYMTITNHGTEADRLTSVSTSAADRAEVHQMLMDNGVMTMRPVEGGLEIKPGETVTLKPQSFHLMLMGLKQPLTQGGRMKATLDFAKAGKVELEYVVESIGAQGPSGGTP